MKKMTREEEEYYVPFIEEAERDIEENGTLSEKEFWASLEEFEKEERRKKQYNQKTKLHMANTLEKISKRFIRA